MAQKQGFAGGRDADEEDEDLMQWEAPNYKDTVLWLIDNGHSMHRIDPDSGKSYVHRAIEVATKMMEHKLVKSPHDRIGILLFNTRETKVPVDGKKMTFHGCYAIAELDQVNVPHTHELREEIADAHREGTDTYWKNKYPPDEGQVRIHYVLGNAESMLNSAGKTGSRRIFFVTNNDDPYKGRSAKVKLQKNALEKIKDMRRRGVEFEAFLISTAERPFSVDLFYADLFHAYDEQTEMMRSDQAPTSGNDASTARKSSWSAFDKFEDLEKDAGSKETPKRVVLQLGLELADGLTIGVAGYNTVSRLTKGNPVKVYREGEHHIWREVVAQSFLQCRETGALLNPATQVYHAFSLGYDATPRNVVRFTPKEINDLKTSGLKPTLKVLGFKDRSTLKFMENVKHSIFIFPTEAEYIGSQRAFAALLKAMITKDKLAIAVFMPRDNSIPEFVAILPQAEERSEDGLQLEPPGMHLIPLPFADDIREMPKEFSTSLQATPEQVKAAGQIVKSYTRNAPFNPDFYRNPALTHHYEALKARAFGVDLDDPIDKTLPEYDGIASRSGHLIDAWENLCEQDQRAKAGAASRGISSGNGNDLELSDKKRVIIYDGTAEEEALNLHAKGQLDKKTTDFLKSALDHYRLSKSGRKAELVGRLQMQLDKVMASKQGKDR